MGKIILASNNKHKIKEFREMFPEEEVLALEDIGFFEDIIEDGSSFEENSLIKARAVQKFLKSKGLVASVIADDSGLCVEALDGAPGIYSARYSGDHDHAKNREKLLSEMQGKLNRKAYFNCTLVELFPSGDYIVAEGKTYGTITTEEIGGNSFGFNCLFLSDDLGKTFGEASSDERNQISHRGRAIAKLKSMRELKAKNITIKQLDTSHAKAFSDLIINMYSNLENLEWFSPMPYDEENVKAIIENPRFYIIGYFENDILCGVSSIDYKCGKLIGKIDLPQDCDTSKLVEFGFTMVHSNCRGRGIMKLLVAELINKAKEDGFEWAFGKVHKNNLASSKSLINRGFYKFADFKKPVKVEDFKALAGQPFFSKLGKINAKKTLARIEENAKEIIVDYEILIKKL